MLSTSNPSALKLDLDKEKEIEKNVSLTQAKDPFVRANALTRLGELHGPIEIFLSACEDSSSRVRTAAVVGLGLIDPEYVTGEISTRLLEALDDLSEWVCSTAIHSLGNLRVESARERIIPFLTDSNSHVVKEAIITLSKLKAIDALPKIMEFLGSKDYLINIAAIRAMGYSHHTPAGPSLLAGLRLQHEKNYCHDIKLCGAYIEAIGKMEFHEAVPLLVEIAQNDVGVRGRSLRALIALNAEEVVPRLAPLLADPSEKLRQAIIKLIVSANYQTALPMLRSLLKDGNGNSRNSALEAVSEMGDAFSVDQIRWMCYHESDYHIRLHAVHALCRLMGKSVVDILIDLSNEQNPKIRETALYRLGLLNENGDLPPTVLPTLQLLTQDPIPEIQQLAQKILAEFNPSTKAESTMPGQAQHNAILPAEIQADIPYLLNAMTNWKTHLRQEIKMEDSEVISHTDQALSFLVSLLESNR